MGNTMRTAEPSMAEDNAADYYDSQEKVTESDILVVLHDYPSPTVSEPIFRTGEKLKVLSEEGCWWKVCSILTENVNYIPNHHVAKVYHSWLFEGVDRQKSEELLYLPGNRVGSFMIRESMRQRGTYSLSVRHRSIKHYRIFRLPNHWYYISPRLTFQCLEDLVNHYSDSADGLCCMLNAPCLALTPSPLGRPSQAAPIVMRRNLDRRNADRSELGNENGGLHSDASAALSFGLRDSISSYLSLARSEDFWSRKSNRKKKSKSMYGLPSQQYRLDTEEDYLEGDI
ncbi:src like adaptor 1a [Scleropages formosus]|uniref:Src like adaptor n=1 Tax=Scleropages formosus TaxID=113540 RepID=A0A8C9RJD3_SCLFO|nr:src-like-adapter [Scleropages formosus]